MCSIWQERGRKGQQWQEGGVETRGKRREGEGHRDDREGWRREEIGKGEGEKTGRWARVRLDRQEGSGAGERASCGETSARQIHAGTPVSLLAQDSSTYVCPQQI